MASREKDAGATYSIYLELKKRMSMLGGETENLWLNSQDGKIPEWRETNAAAAKLTARFNTLNQKARKFLKQFSLCSSDFHKIDDSDSEIKTLLSEMEENRLEFFHKGIQQHLKEADEIDSQLLRQYARVSEKYGEILDIQEGITVDEFAFAIEAFPPGDLDLSPVDTILDRMIDFGENAFELEKLQVDLPPSFNLKQSEKRKLGELSVTDKDLSDVLIEMYGFSASEAQIMEMEYAESLNPKSEIDLSGWIKETIANAKAGFRALKCEGLEFRQDIPLTLRNWLFPLEAGVYNIVRHLVIMIPGREEASEKLQQWRTALEELKRSNDGMVPAVVYKIVQLLETQPLDRSSGLDRDEGVALYQCVDFDQMIDSIQEIVLHLRFVLMVSGIANPLTISSDVLETCELALIQSEEELERLQGSMGAGKRMCRR